MLSSPSLAGSQLWQPGEGRVEVAEATPLLPASKLQDRPPPSCGSPFGSIRAYTGGGGVGADSSSKAAAVQDALQADYRSQLKQYAQQLASKEGEVASLRQQLLDLKQQLGASASRLHDATEQAARSAAQATQLENHVLTLEQQLQQREQDIGLASKQRQAAEQDAAAAKAQVGSRGHAELSTHLYGASLNIYKWLLTNVYCFALLEGSIARVRLCPLQVAAVQKSVASKCTDWEDSRKYYKEQLDLKDAQIKRLEETVQVRQWVQCGRATT
jgi:hypothetical protein